MNEIFLEGISPKISFITTNRCNFNCVYCYNKIKRNKKEIDLDFIRAKSLIEYMNKHYWVNSGIKNIIVEFCGGGEPTLNWDLIKKTVGYIKKIKNINFICIIRNTNGYLSKKKISFIHKNRIITTISFDGTEEFQNLNKKLKNGKNTFNKIKKTLHAFDKLNHQYRIYCIITKKSVNRMKEIISFICENFKPRDIIFKPQLKNYRFVFDIVEFSKKFIIARQYAAENFKINLFSFYNGYKEKPCLGNDFVLNPNGDLMLCNLVQFSKCKNMFYFGNVSSDGKVNFISENIINFRKFATSLINKECKKCIARFYCGARCPHSYLNNMFSKKFCKAMRLIIKDHLKEKASEFI